MEWEASLVYTASCMSVRVLLSQPSCQAQLARALYDNTAESPQELSFRRGDVLRVLQREGAGGLDGWCLCSLHGQQGIVPANRVKLLPAGPVPKPSLAPASPTQPGSSCPTPEPGSEEQEVRTGTSHHPRPGSLCPIQGLGSGIRDLSGVCLPSLSKLGTGRMEGGGYKLCKLLKLYVLVPVTSTPDTPTSSSPRCMWCHHQLDPALPQDLLLDPVHPLPTPSTRFPESMGHSSLPPEMC